MLFQKEDGNKYSTRLYVDTANQSADFIGFFHSDYINKPKSILRIQTLRRPEATEPYHEYLRSLLHDIRERSEYYQKSNNHRDKKRYDNLYDDFLNLLDQIRENKSVNDVIKDTFLLDLVNYCEMDSVANRLINLGFRNRLRVSDIQEQSISIKYIMNELQRSSRN